METPASNAYKPNDGLSSLKKRISNAHMNRDKSPKSMLVPVKRHDGPSPASYEDADKNWKKQSIHPTTNFNYSISKEKKKSFIDIEIKRGSKVPGAGVYKDSMD